MRRIFFQRCFITSDAIIWENNQLLLTDEVWTSSCCIFSSFFPLFARIWINNVLGSSIPDTELGILCLRTEYLKLMI